MPAPLKHRTIHKQGESSELNAAIQNAFVAELLDPGPDVWLVSPWLSDVALLDNRAFGFRHLEPGWPRAPIRLSRLLGTLGRRGTRVHVVTRPERPAVRGWSDYDRDVAALLDSLLTAVPSENLQIVRGLGEESEHRKLFVTQRLLVEGSMNWTYSGVVRNGEAVRLHFDAATIAEAYLECQQTWGEYDG